MVAKRADGYHDLETVFYPVQLRDALEVIPSSNFNFSSSGLSISGSAADNLCVKAWKLLKADFPNLPEVNIHLHKNIPMGAGLGGGSSNGSFMLKMLNDKFRLKVPDEKLLEYALKLGSDCPFFIVNSSCLATGRGEQLFPVEVDLSRFIMIIISPAIHVNTGQAFSRLTPRAPVKTLMEIITQPVITWKDQLQNDFENAVFDQYPQIATIKESLYQSNAVYASMTGSGSSVFGLFNTLPILPSFADCKVSVIKN